KGFPIGVAGCPPDYFSKTGQLWGNPLYDWTYHKETSYSWWMQRLGHCYKLYDVVRIDHFRGFDEYYFIPYGDPTAEFGHWEKGPGYALFETFRKTYGKKPVIAEDLGFLTKSVRRLIKKTGYPGMKILEFAFDSDEENDYLPHNFDSNCVVYTGTHDNDTVLGWYQSAKNADKKNIREYLGVKSAANINWDLIRLAEQSVADTAIIPMQDCLGIGKEGRINLPSTLGTNWKWRMQAGVCTPELAAKLYRMAKIYGRV
ncbi:MAG: 4-alpha-glucanotransferase, partial [Lachnospiraceae bacterium]|nr:4-alpha-glucanotransferase [Lachnospiraceae bacterium]